MTVTLEFRAKSPDTPPEKVDDHLRLLLGRQDYPASEWLEDWYPALLSAFAEGQNLSTLMARAEPELRKVLEQLDTHYDVSYWRK